MSLTAWNAIFVDPRSYRDCVSVEEAVGSDHVQDFEFFWDITDTKTGIDSGNASFGSSTSSTDEPQPDSEMLDFGTQAHDDGDDEVEDDDFFDQVEVIEEIMDADQEDGLEVEEPSPENHPTAPTPPLLPANPDLENATPANLPGFATILNMLEPQNPAAELLAQLHIPTELQAQLANDSEDSNEDLSPTGAQPPSWENYLPSVYVH